MFSHYWRLVCRNVLIGVILLSTALSSIPFTTPLHVRLFRLAAPPMVAAGVVHSPWTMFSPKPRATEFELVVTARLSDKTARVWRSPQWGEEQSYFERIALARHAKFYENVGNPALKALWPTFARVICRKANLAPEGIAVESLELAVEFRHLLSPEELAKGTPMERGREVWLTLPNCKEVRP